MENFYVEYLLQCGLNALNAGITELQYLITIGEDDMIMLLILKCTLIMSCILTKLMLAHQVAINKQLYRVVESCPRNPILLVLHA